MSFLHENYASLKSIEGLELELGELIGEGSNHRVHTIGKTRDGIDIALKQGINTVDTGDIQTIHYQIALLNFIHKELPERRSQLPKFYGIITGTSGRIGIVMDRFTGHYATNFRWNDIEVSEFQEELQSKGLPSINEDYIYPSLFHTIEGMRIGDLLTLSRQAIISMRPTIQQQKLYIVSELLKRYPSLYSIQSKHL